MDVVDRADADTQAVISSVLDRIGKYMVETLNKLETDDKHLVYDQANLIALDGVLDKMSVDVEVLGYSDIIAAEIEALQTIRQGVLEKISDTIDNELIAQKMEIASEEAVYQLMRAAESELVNVKDKWINETGDVIRRSVLAGEKIETLTDSLMIKLSYTRNQISALVQTALFAFYNQITLLDSEEAGIDWFLYDGPNDYVTRVFCQHFVDTRVTKEILNDPKYAAEYDRGESQPTPVSVFLGGYRCRHRLVPLLDDDLKDYKVGPI